MNLIRISTRVVAFALAVTLVASCDNRITPPPCTGVCGGGGGTTSNGSDLVPPTVTVLLAAIPRDTFYLGSPLVVNTTATDDKGVVQVVSTVTNNGVTTTVDSVVTTGLNVNRSFTLSSASLAKGDRLTIQTTATDVGSNPTSATTFATVADTATPRVTIASNVITNKGGVVNGQDSIDVQITAADSAGIATAGFRLRYLRSATDTVDVFSSPVTPASKSLIY